ncbi:MAG: YkgJ family cysteine cluster protein [Thermodesulfobacteriota bacterium]
MAFDFLIRSALIQEQKRFLDKKKEELKPAFYIGANKCQKSGFCCWQRPASVTEEDIERISKKLELTKLEFIKKYCVIDKSGINFNWFPRLNSQDKTEYNGKVLPDEETYNKGPCVFLDIETSLCKIHDFKPEQCKKHECWNANKESLFYAEKTWEANSIVTLFPVLQKEIEEYELD